jgi:hypothetical protein
MKQKKETASSFGVSKVFGVSKEEPADTNRQE